VDELFRILVAPGVEPADAEDRAEIKQDDKKVEEIEALESRFDIRILFPETGTSSRA